MALCSAFIIIESKESRSDFRCDVRDEIDKDIIRDECYHQYLQSHELGIPSYFFILINVSLIPVVTVLYSYGVKSTVSRLGRSYQDAEGVPRNRKGKCRLFCAYLLQLVVSIALGITFIVLLETHFLYPTNFLCSNKKFLVKVVLNRTQFTCFYDKAGDKNFCTKFATAANAIYATTALLEILLILKRARDATIFMYIRQFYADYLKSNSYQELGMIHRGLLLAAPIPLNDVQSAMQTLRENCLRDTEQPTDFKQPFGRPNPGAGSTHDLTMDEIYVNVAILEGGAHHYSAKNLDRWEQLKEYPPDAKDCHFAKPQDIIDKKHANVLVVGRPGIGKTSLSTKLLRLWASGEAFNGNQHFNVVFLLKFRRFNNNNANLSLRDLLAAAETVQSLDDAMWDFIKQEPTKVLLIFDGLDEYSRKEDINSQEDDPTYKNSVEEKMPFSVLYNKLVEGKLLPGVSILTTTRPTAVKCVRHVPFQRTVQIRGFTSDDVKEYVKNFTRGNPEAMEKMWEHIKSNINLFSFCYIPMNCFLICHCLLQIILSESSQALPTKMTDIYEMTVKMFLFNHNREGFSPQELARLKSTHMDQPFDKLPEEFQKILNSLGKIAFHGIKEGRLLYELSEVCGLEDCGLLHKLPDLKRKALDDPPKSQFCFTHLTVQEFFAAKHLVDSKTDEEIEIFVINHINDGTWQVVLQFAAGLLKNPLSSHIFIELLPTEKRKSLEYLEPKTLTYWPATEEDKHLAVQVCKCLYEIKDELQPLLQYKIERIKFNAVEFTYCSLAPIDLAAVLHFLENAREVLYVDLSINDFCDLGAKEVKNLIVNREHKLKRVSLNRNNLTDKAAKDLAAALQYSNCKLKCLHLSDNHFTDNAAKDFAAAITHSNCKLEALYLSGNNFTDGAAKDFAEACKHSNCKLKCLHLSDNHFTDNAAKDFAAAITHSNCKLEALYLSGNNFTDGAATDFAEACKHSNCKLKSLDLRGHNFTKKGCQYLTAAKEQSNCMVFLSKD